MATPTDKDKPKKDLVLHARADRVLYQKVIRMAAAEHRTVSAMVTELVRRGAEAGVKW